MDGQMRSRLWKKVPMAKRIYVADDEKISAFLIQNFLEKERALR